MNNKPTYLSQLCFTLEVLKRISITEPKTSKDIQTELNQSGIKKSLRTVQRMLKCLQEIGHIECDYLTKPYAYKYRTDSPWIFLNEIFQ